MTVRGAHDRSFSPAGAPAGEDAVGPFGLFAIVASLTFLAAGIVWPQAAGALLRLLLATLALGYVLGRLYQAVGPVDAARPVGSPFEGDAGAGVPAPVPEGLRRFTAQVAGAGDARLAERRPIPRQVRETVVAEAGRRLAERRGLELERPGDHPAIRALLTEPTWALIRPDRDAGGEARDARRPVPLSRLGAILDHLERL
jgi:hypothetical protein